MRKIIRKLLDQAWLEGAEDAPEDDQVPPPPPPAPSFFTSMLELEHQRHNSHAAVFSIIMPDRQSDSGLVKKKKNTKHKKLSKSLFSLW